MIEASIVCDSVSPAGKRITTFKLRYPKMIHGEFMTHRVISRNASSSRAIPVAKMIAEVRDTATRAAPVFWGAEQKGMQAVVELDNTNVRRGWLLSDRGYARHLWNEAAFAAVRSAELMVEAGIHKQIVNRILEPFSHINVVATATEWDNFFGLRLDAGAQPEMRALAIAMWEARRASTPREIGTGEWHLPFLNDWKQDKELLLQIGNMKNDASEREMLCIKVSVARCARVSYESFETGQRSTVEEDLRLYERLVGSHPLHASPAEHQATPDDISGPIDVLVEEPTEEDRRVGRMNVQITGRWAKSEEHGNFVGWRQYRKMLPGEAVAPLPAEYRA